MSKFNATIIEIQNQHEINIVTFLVADFKLRMMSLQLNDNMTIGSDVILGVKASSVALAKDFNGELSYSNQLQLYISDINEGTLLSSIQLQSINFELESIITTASKKRMQLKVSDSITALIKSSDLYIVEVL